MEIHSLPEPPEAQEALSPRLWPLSNCFQPLRICLKAPAWPKPSTGQMSAGRLSARTLSPEVKSLGGGGYAGCRAEYQA